MNKLKVLIGKFLYNLGLPYCGICGEKMLLVGIHGYDDEEVYECPKCIDTTN